MSANNPTRLLNQLSKAFSAREDVVQAVRDAIDARGKSCEAYFKGVAVASARHAKMADRIAGIQTRLAEAGGRRFLIGQKTGTGAAERAAAKRMREEAAQARELAAYYRDGIRICRGR